MQIFQDIYIPIRLIQRRPSIRSHSVLLNILYTAVFGSGKTSFDVSVESSLFSRDRLLSYVHFNKTFNVRIGEVRLYQFLSLEQIYGDGVIIVVLRSDLYVNSYLRFCLCFVVKSCGIF